MIEQYWCPAALYLTTTYTSFLSRQAQAAKHVTVIVRWRLWRVSPVWSRCWYLLLQCSGRFMFQDQIFWVTNNEIVGIGMKHPTQCRERLSVVADLKRHYRNSQNGWIYTMKYAHHVNWLNFVENLILLSYITGTIRGHIMQMIAQLSVFCYNLPWAK